MTVIVRDFRTVKDGVCVNYNIGTAAHGPSTVSQVKKYLPGTKVVVWADCPLSGEMSAMMKRRFPDVPVVYGSFANPEKAPLELRDAVKEADAVIVGSSSGVFGSVLASAREFKQATGRPIGLAAMGTVNKVYREFDFGFFRDEIVASQAERKGDVAPVHGYAPDSVFDFDCTNDAEAITFLAGQGLEKGKFVCAIPGMRVTPRWEYWGGEPNQRGIAINAKFEEADHAILRAAICEIVRKFGLKVLVCAEQIPEVALGKRAVMDKLPEDVRAKCVWMEKYWAPDLALSVYKSSLLVLGIEMHSQVMALGNGVPAIVMNHPNFGTKADMWRTIGCEAWLVDITRPDAEQRTVAAVDAILSDPVAATAKVVAARKFIHEKSAAAYQRMKDVICGKKGQAFVFDPPPKAPGPESWKFKEDLAAPERFPAEPVGERKKAWLENRISRCFFGPIKRAPYFRDELVDDVDYYPEEYLKRLQREGVNGLWLTAEFKELATTKLLGAPNGAEKRLAKLKATVEKCAKYGIKIWLFAIEPPYKWKKEDPLVVAHPEYFGSECRGVFRVMCSSAPAVREYLEACTYDIFLKVPGLGGLIVLSHGECPSSCLSEVYPDTGGVTSCPRCKKLKPWEIHLNTMGSMLKGVRRANPEAKVISWLYHPQAKPTRAEWVTELAKHVPEGMILQYNFESGIEAEQLKKVRCGGDYWLSQPGPAAPFQSVAAAVKEAGGGLSAKIQTCNSHELATVPYVPVPGLLYRKFKGMKAAGVTSTMMCWYFGSYPGIMNRAAGELAYSDFTENEDEFLLRLAKGQWGDQSGKIAKIWKSFSDGYSNYPLTNNMQYYGPFHFGVVWPLWPEVNLKPLVETWGPNRPVCGDMIGECLARFTLEDACELAKKMKAGFDIPLDVTAANEERAQDLGVMKALKILIASGSGILDFYRLRSLAIWRSRTLRDHQSAAECVGEMIEIAEKAKKLTLEMIPLAEADSRLGFHSEAESHQFFPALLKWRVKTLDMTVTCLKQINAGLWEGRDYPESEFERNAPRAMVGGAENEGKGVVWKAEMNRQGDLVITGRLAADGKKFSVAVTDAAGTVFPRIKRPDFAADGSFKIVYPQSDWNLRRHERPEWIVFQDNFGSGYPLWPASEKCVYGRLNIGALQGPAFGRLIWPAVRLAGFRKNL